MKSTKKEEEKKIVAEMEAALAESASQKEEESEKKETPVSAPSSPKKRSFYDATTPEQIHCRRCKTLMENGVCPTCGYRMYVPMSKEKQDKIKWIGTVIGLVVFAVLFVVLQISKG
ncbi:MAG: hypothetical protein IJV85_04010 [Clostridia bacterium]|nr:hypothetical protein [Clostridia bacterium]